MRKVIYGGACSLDGFIAGIDGSFDWLHHSKDVDAIMADYWKAIDTLIMGRKTWEVASAMQPPSNAEGESAWGGVKSYVFSRTLQKIDRPGVELVSSDAGAFVRDLKRRKGKNIIVFGGGEFARSLFEADLIDEVGFNIQPILLGAGVPAFRDANRRIKLELFECRQLHGGCVLVNYRVKHARTAKH